MDEMEDIRRRARGGESIASIARAVGASEPTVGKYARMEDLSPEPPRRREHESEVLAPYGETIDSWLDDDCGNWRKQRRMATRAYVGLRDERGKHHFRSNKPNELWITDVTEFRIPAGKAYLSPIVDCFDGMPPSWPVSTSPDAGMASPPLLGACKWLNEGDRPKIRSDRGCHCRWPGWIRICDENGLVRSMPGKGCSPDNARCEGFFGRWKIESFHCCDWTGAALEESMGMLDACLRWYRDVRIKGDLDYRSPMQYRRDLGLAA